MGDMKLIAERLDTENIHDCSDDRGERMSVLAAALRMGNCTIDLIKLILHKGGNLHEDGILQHAVASAVYADARGGEDIALFLISRGADGQVAKSYRRRCPARLR